MPVFNNPRQAIIVEGDDGIWGLIALLICVGVAIGAVVAFVAAHAVLLAECLVVFAVVEAGFMVWCRWVTSEKRFARSRSPVPLSLQARAAVTQGTLAISSKRPVEVDVLALPVSRCLHEHDVLPVSPGPERGQPRRALQPQAGHRARRTPPAGRQ